MIEFCFPEVFASKLFTARVSRQENWICVEQRGGKCESLGLFAVAGVSVSCCVSPLAVPNVSCATKQSCSTVKSKLVGLSCMRKSWRLALRIICTCGECVSAFALFFCGLSENLPRRPVVSARLLAALLYAGVWWWWCAGFHCSVESFHLPCGSLQMLSWLGLCCLFSLIASPQISACIACWL